MKKTSLDAIQQAILNGRDNNNSEPQNTVVVSREGEINTLDAILDVSQPLSKAQPDEFHNPTREQTEAEIAAHYMPKNTQKLTTEDGITGWLYRIKCQLKKSYTFFLFYEGTQYQVMLVAPKLERVYQDQHTSHLMHGGYICLGSQAATAGMQEIYAKSVIWATGMSLLMSGKTNFPF